MPICPMCEQKWGGWDRAALDTRLYFKGHDVHLTNQEARLVAALVKTNRTLSHEYLYDVLWGEDPGGGPEYAESSLKVHISKIRKKLSQFSFNIVTIWGKGYASINAKSLPNFPSLTVVAYALLIPLFLSFPMLAMAQRLCGENDKIAATLKDRYGEERVSVAFTDAGKLMERYENAKTGTWTIVVHPDGSYSCVWATGTEWHEKRVSKAPGA